jgi:AraC-like DNA-binding protein
MKLESKKNTTVSNALAKYVFENYVALNINIDTLNFYTKIDNHDITNSNNRLNTLKHNKLLMFKEKILPLDLSSFINLDHVSIYFPDLANCLANCSSLKQAFETLSAYKNIITEQDKININYKENGLEIYYNDKSEIKNSISPLLFFLICISIIRHYTCNIKNLSIQLTLNKIKQSNLFSEATGYTISSSSSINKLILETDNPICSDYKHYNDFCHKHSIEKLTSTLQNIQSNNHFSDQIKDAIISKLDNTYNFNTGAQLSLEVSNLLGMSRWTMLRKLKLEHTSFEEILHDVKLETSLDLLVNSSLPINSISKSIGFNNSSSFSRFFKKIVGVSPYEYRIKSQREK